MAGSLLYYAETKTKKVLSECLALGPYSPPCLACVSIDDSSL